MRLSMVKEVIREHVNDPKLCLTSIFMEGFSGIGKSEGAIQVSQEEDLPVIDIRFSQMDSVDLRGVPFVEVLRKETERCTRWARPGFLPDASTPRGIFFADELTSGMPSVLAAAYQMFNDRGVGDYRFPQGWLLLAAGNPTASRGVTYQMPAPLLNRFLKIDVTTHLDDFIDHAAMVGLNTKVIAFLQTRADMLYKFDPSSEIKPFPTPRSWFRAAQYVEKPKEIRIELVQGCVGEEAATHFETFLRVWGELPDMDEVRDTPTTAKIPDSLGGKWAVAVSVAEVIDIRNFARVNKYLERLPDEFSMLAGRLAHKRVPKLHVSDGYKDWAQRHGNILHQS